MKHLIASKVYTIYIYVYNDKDNNTQNSKTFIPSNKLHVKYAVHFENEW